MKFVSFKINNQQSIGVYYNDKLVDICQLDHRIPNDLKQLLPEIDHYQKHLNSLLTASDNLPVMDPLKIEYCHPIINPSKVICVGLNYKDHALETKRDLPSYPVFFTRFISSFSAHNQPIIVPSASNKLDFEAELAVVIGKTAYKVKAEDADNYIAGYSIVNDGTVRDFQAKSSQWLLGKNFANSGSFGPVFVTKELLGTNVSNLMIQTRLNGQIMQDSNSSEMIFKPAELIEFITEALTLEAGDIIITGTPAGVGYTRNPPIYLKHGDVCEIFIERIGTLSNMIIKE